MSVEGGSFYSEMAQVDEQGGVFEEHGDNNGSGYQAEGDLSIGKKIVRALRVAVIDTVEEIFGGGTRDRETVEDTREGWFSGGDPIRRMKQKREGYLAFIEDLRVKRIAREAKEKGASSVIIFPLPQIEPEENNHLRKAA